MSAATEAEPNGDNAARTALGAAQAISEILLAAADAVASIAAPGETKREVEYIAEGIRRVERRFGELIRRLPGLADGLQFASRPRPDATPEAAP